MGLQEHLLKVVDKILVDFFPRLLVEGRHGTSALGIPLLIWGRPMLGMRSASEWNIEEMPVHSTSCSH
eukprot:1151346-Pelagomonas_calceolata.AAC.2